MPLSHLKIGGERAYTIIYHTMYLLLSLVRTCPKNRKNRGFLRFPDTGILTTIAILRTARIANCSCYLPVMVQKL